jgi:hypothetical protein
MSLSINDYLESLNAITAASQNVSAANTTNQADTVSSEKDSYIASEIDADSVLPSDNYNDILDVIRSAKAELNSSSDNSDSDTGSASVSSGSDTEAVGSAGGSGGGGGSDSDDEDETTTEVVTINGQTYLETTTTSNGITTVTRTKIGASEEV